MDAYTPTMLEQGIKGMIGKGSRSKEVVDSMKKNGVTYFAAVGGAAALIAKSVKKYGKFSLYFQNFTSGGTCPPDR